MWELSKSFRFEAAHTLRRTVEVEPSRRIHGHSYRADVVLRGVADPASGMLIDLGLVEEELRGLREMLDHRMLDEIDDLGPGTLENLAAWIWRRLAPRLPLLWKVSVRRESLGDCCSYFGPGPA